METPAPPTPAEQLPPAPNIGVPFNIEAVPPPVQEGPAPIDNLAPFNIATVTEAPTSLDGSLSDGVVSDTQPEMPVVAGTERAELKWFQKVRKKLGKIALGEGVGTAFDVVTMATGVPLPLREAAASTMDTFVYSPNVEAAREPSRMRRIGRATGFTALNFATGYLAQKYGPGLVETVNGNLDQGVMGEFALPLGIKAGAILSVNSAVNNIFRR